MTKKRVASDQPKASEKKATDKQKQRTTHAQTGKQERKKSGAITDWRDKVAQIRDVLQSIKDDEIPEKLWDLVEWVVEHGYEEKVKKLFDDETLNEDAIDTLEFVLEEIGYRLPILLQPVDTNKKTGKSSEYEHGEMIPFGIIFTMLVREKDLGDFPTILSTTMKAATDQRIVRRACHLDE